MTPHPRRSLRRQRLLALLLGALLAGAPEPLATQGRRKGVPGRKDGTAEVDRYDDVFRKYSKRFFGPAYDWRVFKAQGMAESNLDPSAKSHVGARGIMQLMPSTFAEVRSKNPDVGTVIDDPEFNIAAGIMYDARLWNLWDDHEVEAERRAFTFASYNAGRRTILNAQAEARKRKLDPFAWRSIESVAPRVKRWRHEETLGYIRRIRENLARMDAKGRVGK